MNRDMVRVEGNKIRIGGPYRNETDWDRSAAGKKCPPNTKAGIKSISSFNKKKRLKSFQIEKGQ